MPPRCPFCGNPAVSRFTGREQTYCERHWNKVPAKLKRQFWTETEYGKRWPRPELAAEVHRAIEERN